REPSRPACARCRACFGRRRPCAPATRISGYARPCARRSFPTSRRQQRRDHMIAKGLGFINAVLAATFVATRALAADWPSARAGLNNSRYQDKESRISARTVGSLQLKWTLATSGDVTANPTVDGKYLYFPDSAGFLYKVDKDTGTLIWKKAISA